MDYDELLERKVFVPYGLEQRYEAGGIVREVVENISFISGAAYWRAADLATDPGFFSKVDM